jgi:hypothetical protein
MRWTLLLAVAALTGCASVRQTDPPTTAEELLLVSTAVDRAVGKLKLDIPPGSRVFVDASNVDVDQSNANTAMLLPKYTIAAVRDQVLRLGYKVVAERKDAEYVVEVRNGGQAIDDKQIILGIPNTTLPVPLTGPITVPELAIFKYHRQHGLSKLGLAVYGKDGSLAYSTGSQFGDSEQKHWTLLFLITFTSHDLVSEDVK